MQAELTWLTVDEVVAWTREPRLRPRQVLCDIDRGELRAIRSCNGWLVAVDDLERWWYSGGRPKPVEPSYVEILRDDPCAYCGAPVEEIDHIHARSKSGPDAWTNTTGACAACNRRKRSGTLLAFLLFNGRWSW